MDYKVRYHDSGYAIVELSGDIDVSCSPDARSVMLDCLDSVNPVVVDLSRVTYIDSSGVASLVEAYQMAKKKHLRFGLISVSEEAMSVLQLGRLDKVFPIHTSLEERLRLEGY
jgi:anti-sigma B factor antagonist